MDVRPLEVYAEDSNCAIVKPLGRHYPGSVIQGDSLSILCRLAVSIAQRIRDCAPDDEELLGDVQELVHLLVGRILHYQLVLQRHDIELPYSRRFTEMDLVQLLPEDSDSSC